MPDPEETIKDPEETIKDLEATDTQVEAKAKKPKLPLTKKLRDERISAGLPVVADTPEGLKLCLDRSGMIPEVFVERCGIPGGAAALGRMTGDPQAEVRPTLPIPPYAALAAPGVVLDQMRQ